MVDNADAGVPFGERALNALTDVVLICDYDRVDGQIIVRWCNDAAVLATGLKRAEIIGLPARSLLMDPGEYEQPEMRRAFLEAARKDGVAELTRPTSHPDTEGPAMLRVRAFCRDPEAGEVVLVVEGLRP